MTPTKTYYIAGTRSFAETNERSPRIYPAGRVCTHEGCVTVLSRYNGGSHCGAHENETPQRALKNFVSRRSSPRGMKACVKCRAVLAADSDNFGMGRAGKLKRMCLRCSPEWTKRGNNGEVT